MKEKGREGAECKKIQAEEERGESQAYHLQLLQAHVPRIQLGTGFSNEKGRCHGYINIKTCKTTALTWLEGAGGHTQTGRKADEVT